MPAEERSYWELLEPIFESINIYEGPEAYAASIAELPRRCVMLYAMHMSLAEIYNGEFLQLFWNNTGIVVPDAVEGFALIEMPKASALLTRAAGLLGDSYPLNREDRWDALLAGSGLGEAALKASFAGVKNLYLGFQKATEALPFAEMMDELLELAEEENGGFQRAATAFAGLAAAVPPVQ